MLRIDTNFNWVLFCEDETEFFNYGKLLFEKPDTALFSHFQDSNAAFGIFLSKAFEEGRLRLEARPAKFLQTSDGTERFGFTCDFNFHFDIDASANQELLMKRLSRFSICRKYSETIVDSI